MNYEKEMANYRAKLTGKRRKRQGRRKTDVLSKPFLVAEIVWQLIFLAAVGMLLLSACARSAYGQ